MNIDCALVQAAGPGAPPKTTGGDQAIDAAGFGAVIDPLLAAKAASGAVSPGAADPALPGAQPGGDANAAASSGASLSASSPVAAMLAALAEASVEQPGAAAADVPPVSLAVSPDGRTSSAADGDAKRKTSLGNALDDDLEDAVSDDEAAAAAAQAVVPVVPVLPLADPVPAALPLLAGQGGGEPSAVAGDSAIEAIGDRRAADSGPIPPSPMMPVSTSPAPTASPSAVAEPAAAVPADPPSALGQAVDTQAAAPPPDTSKPERGTASEGSAATADSVAAPPAVNESAQTEPAPTTPAPQAPDTRVADARLAEAGDVQSTKAPAAAQQIAPAPASLDGRRDAQSSKAPAALQQTVPAPASRGPRDAGPAAARAVRDPGAVVTAPLASGKGPQSQAGAGAQRIPSGLVSQLMSAATGTPASGHGTADGRAPQPAATAAVAEFAPGTSPADTTDAAFGEAESAAVGGTDGAVFADAGGSGHGSNAGGSSTSGGTAQGAPVQGAAPAAPPAWTSWPAGQVPSSASSSFVHLSAADDPVVPQLVRALHVQLRDGVSEARLQLEPNHLGAVSVALRVENGVVSAVITAEQPAVRHWLETHEASLRGALSDQGLQLDRLRVEPDGRQASGHSSTGQEPPPRRRMLRKETATFELVA